MPTLRLPSNDGSSLTIEREATPDPIWWRVTLKSPRLSAAIDFDADAARYAPPISDFFASLAADWAGWDGAKTWTSIDCTLRLSATHDGLGHIALRAELTSAASPDAWQAAATINLDAGRLQTIARDAANFAAS